MELDPQAVISDAAVMREFRSSQTGDCWKRYLNLMITDFKDRACQKESGDWEKGIVEGLKLALQVPEKVIQLGKDADRAQRAKPRIA